jgi:hypothetical protein
MSATEDGIFGSVLGSVPSPATADDDTFGAPPEPGAVAWRALVHGRYRRDIAAELGVKLGRVNELVRQETTRRIAAQPSPRERAVLIDSLLDTITEHAFATLDRGAAYSDPALMLRTLVEVAELRLRLLALTNPRTTDEGNDR